MSETPANDDSAGGEATRSPGWARRIGRLLWRVVDAARWVSLLILLAVAVYLFTPLGDRAVLDLIEHDPLEKADYIVVLAGGRQRAVEAANLYKDGWAPKVIASTTPGFKDVYSDLLDEYGVPAADVLLDPVTARTATHPETVARIPGVDPQRDRFLLITSRLHTSRAKACFVKAGFEHVLVRYPSWYGEKERRVSASNRFVVLGNVIREWAAWGYYRLRGWV